MKKLILTALLVGVGLYSWADVTTAPGVVSPDLPAGGVTTQAIADGAVTPDKVSFNFATSTGAGGAAISINCAPGEVLTGDGSCAATSGFSHGDGANCSAGEAPLGVDAAGAVQSCFDVATQPELDSKAGEIAASTTTLAGDISTVAGTANAALPKAGGTMTGQLNLTGPTGNVVSQASVTASAFFGNGANITGIQHSQLGGVGADDHFTHAASLSALNTQVSASLADGPHTTDASALTSGTLPNARLDNSSVTLLGPTVDHAELSNVGADDHFTHANSLATLNSQLGTTIADGPHLTDTFLDTTGDTATGDMVFQSSINASGIFAEGVSVVGAVSADYAVVDTLRSAASAVSEYISAQSSIVNIAAGSSKNAIDFFSTNRVMTMNATGLRISQTGNPSNALDVIGSVLYTGQLKGGDGTYAAPSYSFFNDLTSGFSYDTGTDQLSFSVNGSSVTRLDADGIATDGSIWADGINMNGDILSDGTEFPFIKMTDGAYPTARIAYNGFAARRGTMDFTINTSSRSGTSTYIRDNYLSDGIRVRLTSGNGLNDAGTQFNIFLDSAPANNGNPQMERLSFGWDGLTIKGNIVGDSSVTASAFFGDGSNLTSLTGANVSGAVPSATALAANGANCSAGNAPLGVDASGAAEGCFDVATQAELDASHKAIVKTADQSVSNSIVLQNDSQLFSSLAANSTYTFRLTAIVSSTSDAPDLTFGFTIPAGAAISATYIASELAGSVVAGHIDTQDSGDIINIKLTDKAFIHLRGVVSTAGTTGNLQFRWAQRLSDATPTIVEKFSSLVVEKK